MHRGRVGRMPGRVTRLGSGEEQAHAHSLSVHTSRKVSWTDERCMTSDAGVTHATCSHSRTLPCPVPYGEVVVAETVKTRREQDEVDRVMCRGCYRH